MFYSRSAALQINTHRMLGRVRVGQYLTEERQNIGYSDDPDTWDRRLDMDHGQQLLTTQCALSSLSSTFHYIGLLRKTVKSQTNILV